MTASRRKLIVAAIVLIAASPIALGADLTRAPVVTLNDLKDAKVKIDYQAGKLTLVNFWAVWCGPCREEMPQIAKLVGKYGKQGFKAIGIAVESGAANDVKAFLDENKAFGINYPILLGDDTTLTKFGDVQAVPTTFLVDPEGKVTRRFIGVTPSFAAKLEEEIKKALAPADPPKPAKP